MGTVVGTNEEIAEGEILDGRCGCEGEDIVCDCGSEFKVAGGGRDDKT